MAHVISLTMRSNHLDDSIPLVDLSLNNSDIEHSDLERMHSKGNLLQRLILHAVQSMKGLFWDPYSCEAYINIRSLRDMKRQMRDHLNFLQYFISLNQKREDFSKTEEDVIRDKAMLQEEMDGYERTLLDLGEHYKEKRAMQENVFRLQSDIKLTLSKYERCNNCYSLFNNILDVIHKTLLSIDTTEKLKNLCGIVNNTHVFQSCGYSSMGDTMHKLVKDIAACEDAKSHIESQLTLAKSKSIGVALHVGSDVDSTRTDILTDNFIRTGEILFELPNFSKPSSMTLPVTEAHIVSELG